LQISFGIEAAELSVGTEILQPAGFEGLTVSVERVSREYVAIPHFSHTSARVRTKPPTRVPVSWMRRDAGNWRIEQSAHRLSEVGTRRPVTLSVAARSNLIVKAVGQC